jgi:hypothetical protein
VLLPALAGTVCLLVFVVGRRRRRRVAPDLTGHRIPGLTPPQAEDFLWLDRLLSSGLSDGGVRQRYLSLATRVELELSDLGMTVTSVPALECLQCPWCERAWGTSDGCPMCTDSAGTPAPLYRRLGMPELAWSPWSSEG